MKINQIKLYNLCYRDLLNFYSFPFKQFFLNRLLFLGFLCFSILVNAQSINAVFRDVVMSSPTASGLGKYGDIPVNLSTGVPNISIPIYNIQEGPLRLPINLSYHASGIKMSEQATWIGLGWSTHYGGIISRTVLGVEDENYYGYQKRGYICAESVTNYTNCVNEIRNAGTGATNDTEPDIFSFQLENIRENFI